MGTSALRKAAIVLQSLPEKIAAELLGRLDPAEAKAVGDEMARLGRPDPGEQAAAVQEFAAAFPKQPEPEIARPFQFLFDMKPKALADLLGDERPQTIALVLSYLPVELAADALDALPPERQTPIIRCLSAMERPGEEVVRDVEAAIQHRLSGEEPGEGIVSIVKMLGAMRPAGERRLLGELAETDPDLLRKIRRKMFGPDVAPFVQGEAVGAA